ncbi:MAG: hypothetical protein IKM02_00845, partial [Clostridia bacterium]|nr:hypothetical protein [Clostridia bacterium]
IGWGPECLISPYVREKKNDEKPGRKSVDNRGKKPGEGKNAKPEGRNAKNKNAKAEQPRQEKKPKHPVKGGGKPAGRTEGGKKPAKGRR